MSNVRSIGTMAIMVVNTKGSGCALVYLIVGNVVDRGGIVPLFACFDDSFVIVRSCIFVPWKYGEGGSL